MNFRRLGTNSEAIRKEMEKDFLDYHQSILTRKEKNMIITNQDGSAIANMVGGAIIEIDNYPEHFSVYLRICDSEVLLGCFHTFGGAREWLERIEAAYLRGDTRFKVGCEEDLEGERDERGYSD